MGEILQADTRAIVDMARQTLAAAQAVSDAWPGTSDGPHVPRADLSHNAVAAALWDDIDSTVSAGELAIGRLVGALEVDVDMLYRVAFAYQEADEDGATNVRAATRGSVTGRE